MHPLHPHKARTGFVSTGKTPMATKQVGHTYVRTGCPPWSLSPGSSLLYTTPAPMSNQH